MRLQTPGRPHLTYCTNIHPGESWPAVRENLERHTLEVKRAVAPDRPFGLGLRLSARAAEALDRPDEIAALRGFFDEHGIYLFTLNGFPYGPFHGEPVKEDVYLPDWTDPARLEYTDRLARLMSALMAEGEEGSISTVPGAFRERVPGDAEADAIAAMVLRHAAHLFRLREETGRSISLALEPEPCCYLELVDEAIAFVRDRLRSRAALSAFAAQTGLRGDAAEEFLRHHVGVCFDTCHQAVEFEECEPAVRSLQREGIRIVKAQITAGLEVEFDGTAGDRGRIEALRPFAEGVYLHQVVEQRADGLRRHVDLPQALQRWAAGDPPRRCRIHFHVPVFREELGAFRGTQPFVSEFLALVRDEALVPHLEVETYTWDVLPEEFRRESLEEAIAGELRWVLDRLGE